MRYRVWILLILTILTCQLSYAAQVLTQKAKPAQTSSRPKAVTYTDIARMSASHLRRMFVDTYKSSGHRDPKWDANVLSLLEHFVTLYARRIDEDYADTSLANNKDANIVGMSKDTAVLAQGRDAVAKGCDDAIVLTCLGFMLYQNNELAESEHTFRSALDGFAKNPKLPRDVARVAPMFLLLIHIQASDLSLGDSKSWRQLLIKWTAEAQCDGSFLPSENRILYWYLYGSQTYLLDNVLGTLYNAAKSVSKPDTYFVNVIGGMAGIEDAWADRGSKAASEVTEEGWKGFKEHIAIGRKLFTEAWKLNPSYPEAPSGMISIAMAGADRSEPRLWFDRTVAAQIDYGAAYYRYEYAILPRWGGSIKKLNDFGIECLNTKRYDTWIPWRYLRILSVIRKESDEDKTCWTTPEAIKHLDEMFDGYEKSGMYNKLDPNFFPSLRAATAWYCGRYDEARKLCDALGDKLNITLFQDFYSTPYETAKADIEKSSAAPKNPETVH